MDILLYNFYNFNQLPRQLLNGKWMTREKCRIMALFACGVLFFFKKMLMLITVVCLCYLVENIEPIHCTLLSKASRASWRRNGFMIIVIAVMS